MSFLLLVSTAFTSCGAEDISSARVFVTHVYAQYKAPADVKESEFVGPDFFHKIGPTVFSPSLLRLIRRDQRDTPKGDVGKLDFDPICACQDFDGLQLTSLKITPVAPTRALAVVSLRYQPQAITVRLKLIQTADGWRIDDIADPEMPSLRRLLAPTSTSARP